MALTPASAKGTERRAERSYSSASSAGGACGPALHCEDQREDAVMKAVQFAAPCAFAAVAGAIPVIVYSQIAAPGAVAKGTWTQKAPMITARSEVSLAEVGGKIYVLGGGINGTSVPPNEEYDIATDKWRVRYPMPRGLDHMGVAVVNGKIITVGGFVGAGVHRDGQPMVFEYDPTADAWRALAPLKAGLGSVGVAVLNRKVYAIGGGHPAARRHRDQ